MPPCSSHTDAVSERLFKAEEALPGYLSNQLLHAGFGQLGGLYPFMQERFDMLYGMYRTGTRRAGKEVDDPGKPEQFLRRMSDYKRKIYVDTHSMSAEAG